MTKYKIADLEIKSFTTSIQGDQLNNKGGACPSGPQCSLFAGCSTPPLTCGGPNCVC